MLYILPFTSALIILLLVLHLLQISSKLVTFVRRFPVNNKIVRDKRLDHGSECTMYIKFAI